MPAEFDPSTPPNAFVVRHDLAWWTVADSSGIELYIASMGEYGAPMWESALPAVDVENWDETPWEDVVVSHAEIQEMAEKIHAFLTN
jgi:hypothetical protein